MFKNQKTVVLSQNGKDIILGVLNTDIGKVEVLHSKESFINPPQIRDIDSWDEVREATRMDFHRFGVSFCDAYLINNEGYVEDKRSNAEFLLELNKDDPRFAQLYAVCNNDRFTKYTVTFKNGTVMTSTAACLLSRLSQFLLAGAVSEYKIAN